MTGALILLGFFIGFGVLVWLVNRLFEWLAALGLKRAKNAEFEEAVAQALATVNHPAYRAVMRETSERLFSDDDAAWLNQQGIRR